MTQLPNLGVGPGRGIWQTNRQLSFNGKPLSAKKRTKSAKTNSRGGAAGTSARASETAAADTTDPREDSDGADGNRREHAQATVRTSPRIPAVNKQQEAGEVPRPPLLESVFSPVEIDFFERAADMYADEYDVWEDFRRVEFN